MVEKWFRGLKWDKMLLTGSGAAGLAHEFCTRNGLGEPVAAPAAGVAALLAIFCFFMNPKNREWVPEGAVVVDRFAAPEEPRFAVELPVAPPQADIPAWKTGGVGALTPEEEAVVLALRSRKEAR